LDLVGIKEPQPFVDIGGNAALLERLLELAVTGARSKQDGDVPGARPPRHTGLTISHAFLAQDPDDFLGDGRGRALGILLGRKSEHWTARIRDRVYGTT